MLLFPYRWVHATPIQDTVKGKSPSEPRYWSPWLIPASYITLSKTPHNVAKVTV